MPPPLSTKRLRRIPITALGWLAMMLSLFVLAPRPTSAQVPLFPDEIQRIDVIAIERDGRDVFAFDALTGGRSRVQLEVGETVLFQETRGRVGLVLTDRRALGVTTGGGFQELRYRLHEGAPTVGLVEDRLALVVTEKRALGFVGSMGWAEARFSPHESPEALRAGAAAAVVVTNRRALGLAPDLGHFVVTDLRVKESLESVAAQDTLVTIRTDRRILVFSAPRAFWREESLQLN